ncbi:NAD(P)-binding protein [Stipitochalara longipes BDJ]|nr:NAD(P)-binding protein [Stipitochalara longipes BDJ]
MVSPKGTIVATGAASGIGSGWLISHLKSPQAKLYHTIYIIHPSAPGTLKENLQAHAPSEHTYEIFPLDLSKMSEVRTAATKLNKRIEKGDLGKIKLLMLIAGAMFLDPKTKDGVTFTEEGIESHIAVNYLSNYLLILILLQSLDRKGARIIAMGSTNHNPDFLSTQGSFHSKELKILFGEKGLEDLVKATEKVRTGDAFPASVRRYGRSKWCLIAFFYELQRRLDRDPEMQNISCLLEDPGLVAGTTLLTPMPFYIRWIIMYLMIPIGIIGSLLWTNGRFRTTVAVGRALVWCSWDTATLGQRPKGLYVNGMEISASSKETYDEVKQGRLWRESAEIVGLKEGEVALTGWK